MTLDAELSQSQDERLQEVLAGYLRDVEAGRNPDQQEILARHPELAGELQDFFAGQEKFGRLAAPLRQAIEPIPDVGIPGTLGDFRILRQVGKGGMGVVYEAEQISLRRRVALKVLPFAATMDPRHLQRFHNEAQAAACLHHTNIVPVFFVGCERGVHFYAMQFIDGQPLSEVIRQMQRLEKKAQPKKGEKTVAYQPSAEEAVSTPLPAAELTPLSGEGPRGRDYYRKVAELGIQAAEALDHAHQLGIVHRDIKPGNLLLDGMGRVWVTDFGLAHIQHSEASLTATGQALGTPRYMSPEQALAKRVPIDHRTDVYSLGVTLYELLTLRPAFASEDRHELLRQIAFEEPSRPRRLDRSIPAELEIIVLKAMEKRPQERYATAQEMADDLERWLKYEPIRARRPTMLQHASKWMRRHRRAVAASAALFLMALMLAGYITWTRHDQTLRRLAIERAILAASKESNYWQEQRRLPEALSAARRGDGLLAGADVDEDLRQRVHKRLADLELLDRLENIRLEKLFPDKGRDHSRDEDEVDRLYAKTFGDAGLDVENLPVEEMGEHLRNSTVAVELAAVIDDWALVCQGIRGADDPSWKALLRVARLADPDALRTRVRESLERQDRQALQAVTSSADVFQLSPVTLSLLDAAYRSEEARGKREAFLREAQRRHPNDFWLNNHLINFYLKCVPPRWEEALPFLTVAVALRPDSAAAHHNLGIALVDKGHLDEGIAESREAIHLKKDYPEAYHSLGYALHRKGHLDEAISEYREALRIKKDYAEVYSVLGLALKDKGRLDEAIAACREAIRIDKDLPEAHCNLGNALFDKGLLDEAIAEYRAALRSKKFFLEAYNAHNGLANALAVTGRLDEAMAEVHKLDFS